MTADEKLKDLIDVLEGPPGWKADLEQAIQDKVGAAERNASDFIALVCPVENCNRATVTPRDPNIDPPAATAVFMPCTEHYEEGAEADYVDEYGKDVVDDPETYKDMSRFKLYTQAELDQAVQEARIKARRAEHQSWSIVYGIGYDPDNQELPQNINTLREKWSRDELEINAQLKNGGADGQVS